MISLSPPKHIALHFGHLPHFREGLGEVSRRLGEFLAAQAPTVSAERGIQFHYILPRQWHGLFGSAVNYHPVTEEGRWRHRFPVDLAVWHALHHHMRYRPPVNCRCAVITVHDLNHVYAKRGLSLWWQNQRLARQIRRAQHLVTITDFVAQDLRRHFAWAPPSTVIHNGVADLSQAPKDPVPALLPLQGQPYLLHLSRMSASKNVGALLDMAALWPEQPLVLAGPSSTEVKALHPQVLARGLKHVHVVEDATDAQKAWLYDHCRAFLFPSLMEGFGLPPIEAMAFGKPAVVARRSCLPEVCGPHAGYWDGFDPATMKAVVQEHLSRHEQDPEAAARLRDHAQRYSWRHVGPRYLQLYEALCSTAVP